MAGGKRKNGNSKFDAKEWLDKKIEKMEQIGSNSIVVKTFKVNGVLYNLRIVKSQNGFLRLELRRNRARMPTINIRIGTDVDAIREFARVIDEKYERYLAIANEIAERNGVSGVVEIAEQEEDEYL